MHMIQLLAGANINDVTANRRSALHIASENNRGFICSILIENHIQTNLLDSNQNTGMCWIQSYFEAYDRNSQVS